MVDHPTTGGCKAASIIRNKRATDFLNVSVGEATDARHASVSDCLVEWYCHQPCTNSPNWMYYCCVIPHGRLVASPTVAGYYLAPLNSTLLSQADMHIISYLISYISYLISLQIPISPFSVGNGEADILQCIFFPQRELLYMIIPPASNRGEAFNSFSRPFYLPRRCSSG